MSEREDHQKLTNRFISLANELKSEGYSVSLVSGALMYASGIYATYSVAGNAGGLQPSGVDKVTDKYRQTLEHIQQAKKAAAGQAPSAS